MIPKRHQAMGLTSLSLFEFMQHVECDFQSLLNNKFPRYFNPRIHIECDPQVYISCSHGLLFQSIHPYRM